MYGLTIATFAARHSPRKATDTVTSKKEYANGEQSIWARQES